MTVRVLSPRGHLEPFWTFSTFSDLSRTTSFASVHVFSTFEGVVVEPTVNDRDPRYHGGESPYVGTEGFPNGTCPKGLEGHLWIRKPKSTDNLNESGCLDARTLVSPNSRGSGSDESTQELVKRSTTITTELRPQEFKINRSPGGPNYFWSNGLGWGSKTKSQRSHPVSERKECSRVHYDQDDPVPGVKFLMSKTPRKCGGPYHKEVEWTRALVWGWVFRGNVVLEIRPLDRSCSSVH